MTGDKMAGITIRQVRDARDRKAFLDLPFRLYANDPAWVPPLYVERDDHLTKNPFFQHAEAQLFLAERDGQVVGRISAQIDRLHLERYNDATGQFGFIEAEDDPAIFAALFAAAESWLKARGMKRVQGPFSFSINEETGLLIDGFNTPPYIMMGHAKPFYDARVQAQGFAKAKDVIAYEYDLKTPMPRAITRMIEKNKASGKLKLRPMSKKHLARDLEIIISIFNDAWSENWNFVPMTDAEVKALGQVLKWLVTEGHIAIAEYEGEAAAMIVTLPDINGWIHDLSGKLLPFNWAKLLWRVLFTPEKGFRVPLMGVRKAYRSTAAGAILAFAVIDTVHEYHRKRGTFMSELSWILEDNMPMRRIIEALGGVPYKTYRIYEKAIA
ncbi:MAG: dATP pyrophosphohydrolase [Aestuariivirgaceae bacterium]|nr:dATP pyrophosphohydrolase [Aestuariivirgaceae bacterium]